jgi:hypothetical protein
MGNYTKEFDAAQLGIMNSLKTLRRFGDINDLRCVERIDDFLWPLAREAGTPGWRQPDLLLNVAPQETEARPALEVR